MRLCAIDIGSNSVRQLVADVSQDGSIRVVDEMKASPRLAAGLDAAGRLEDAAMARAIESLVPMAMLAKRLGADRTVAVATSAVRDATNGEEFLRRVRASTGLDVRILTAADEARLAFRSALAHFELGAGRAVVLDIGGGSVELACSADGLVDRLESLPLGAIRVTEQFFSKKTTPKRVRALREHVAAALKPVLPLRDWRGATLIGSGGTFTNLATMIAAKEGGASASTVHGTIVNRAALEHQLELLSAMSPEERAGVPGLNPARADIIVGALAVAAEVLARIDARDLHVSAYGIREGLLLEEAAVPVAVADPGEARARSIRQFAERCHYEQLHAETVQRHALELFDATSERLGLSAADRAILADAALLHDVGYHINYAGHHKHSYHLIRHADLLGLTPEEQTMIANVARYHRGARPRKRHRNLAGLEKGVRKRIVKLSALLRIADGLDRGHVGAVRKVRVRWLARAVRISPLASRGASLRLELLGASKKAGLLEKIAKRPVELIAPNGVVHLVVENGRGEIVA